MSDHALLSPSGASRWLACTPSARLEQLFKDNAGTAAEEGTLAHAISELLIGRKLSRVIKKVYDQKLAEFKAHPLYEPSMFDYCEDYSVFVMEKYNEALAQTPDAKIFLETRLNMTKYVPEGFGTADVLIVADAKLVFIDLKYGKGVSVSAFENKQLLLYAVGAVDRFELDFDFSVVEMVIYQPRLDNISSFEITVSQLSAWCESTLKPRAILAFAGEGVYEPGDHCRFCRAKTTCKANAEYQLMLAKYEFMKADLLDEYGIADILTRSDSFTNWIEAVGKYALEEAVKGRHWPGFKVVAGRSNRSYIDEVEVVKKLVSLGHKEDDLYNRKIKGIGDMETELGKTDFNKHLTDLLHKPPGKPALVPESDPRPVLNRAEQAAEDFKDINL